VQPITFGRQLLFTFQPCPLKPHLTMLYLCCATCSICYNWRFGTPKMGPVCLKFELGWDLCTVHLPPKCHRPMFSRSEVAMLTNKRAFRMRTSTSLQYATRWGKSCTHADRVPWTVSLLTMVLIALAIFLLEHGQNRVKVTAGHSTHDLVLWSPYPVMATAGVGD